MLICEWRALKRTPVFLIDGRVYTSSISTLVGQILNKVHRLLLAQGKCNRVRSYLIADTLSLLKCIVHCILIGMTFTDAIKAFREEKLSWLFYIEHLVLVW